MELVIVTGMSGAGKTQAAKQLEDMGFFCVDNLPVPMIPKFAELSMAGAGEYSRVVLVTDVRAGATFEGLFQALGELEAMKCPYRILFMDASDDTIIKRYKETRRSHPLGGGKRILHCEKSHFGGSLRREAGCGEGHCPHCGRARLCLYRRPPHGGP